MSAKAKKITATEAARNFSDMLNRVHYRRERFEISRGGEVIARVEPAQRRMTMGELRAFLKSLPPLSEEEAREWQQELAASRAASFAARTSDGTPGLNAAEIKERLSREKETLARLGVASLRLFGSRARGGAKSTSDADFLVVFDGPTGFDRYMDLKLFLEDTLNCEIDLVTEAAVKPGIRESIERDAIRVA